MTKQRGSFNIAVVAVALGALYNVAALLAQSSPTTIHQGTIQRPEVIAVVADNFTQEEIDDFNDAAANLFTYGLFDGGVFGNAKDVFTVTTVFHAVPSTTRASRYGFKVGTDPTSNCSILWNQDGIVTDDAINRDVENVVPEASRFIVIGNYDYTFGCSDGLWAYVSAGSVGLPVIDHELAHVKFGLLDEFSLPQNQSTPYPDGPMTRTNVNCSTDATSPYWMNPQKFPGAGFHPGCALFGVGIGHAYDHCTMGAHGGEFCPVCQSLIEATVECWRQGCGETEPNTPSSPANVRVSGAGFFFQPAQPTARMLRLMLRVSRAPGAAIQVISATDAAGTPPRRQQRLGDYVYEISEGGKPLAVGVIPGDPFQTRSYRGGATQHRSSESDTASIIVMVADVTRQMVLDGKRSPAISFYKLSPEVGAEPITIANFNTLRGSQRAALHAQLPAGALREAMKGVAAK